MVLSLTRSEAGNRDAVIRSVFLLGHHQPAKPAASTDILIGDRLAEAVNSHVDCLAGQISAGAGWRSVGMQLVHHADQEAESGPRGTSAMLTISTPALARADAAPRERAVRYSS
jgi:hypothetical protein